MTPAVTWYFSRALGVVGLCTGAFQVAWLAVTGSGAGELLTAVGIGILLTVGGMLGGAAIDVLIQVRRRSRGTEPPPRRRRR